MGDNSAAAVAFHLCRSYCINARRSPRENINVKFSFERIRFIWITMDEHNIGGHFKLQYKLLNANFNTILPYFR